MFHRLGGVHRAALAFVPPDCVEARVARLATRLGVGRVVLVSPHIGLGVGRRAGRGKPVALAAGVWRRGLAWRVEAGPAYSPAKNSRIPDTTIGVGDETLSKPRAACAIWDEKVREIPVAGLAPWAFSPGAARACPRTIKSNPN
jgi:hypothetical protein